MKTLQTSAHYEKEFISLLSEKNDRKERKKKSKKKETRM
jgi:hypothetical protein